MIKIISPALAAMRDSFDPCPTDLASCKQVFADGMAIIASQLPRIESTLDSYGVVADGRCAGPFFEHTVPLSRVWQCSTAKHVIHSLIYPGITLLLCGLDSGCKQTLGHALANCIAGFNMLNTISTSIAQQVSCCSKLDGKLKRSAFYKSEIQALLDWANVVNSELARLAH